MNNILDIEHDIKQYSTLTLAYIGDSVYELMMREYLLSGGNCRPAKLHEKAIKMVNASAQAKAVLVIMDKLTENEISIFKRGKNAHPKHVAKSATISEYHMATGFETLWGYIYLCKNIKRLNELFNIICTEFLSLKDDNIEEK